MKKLVVTLLQTNAGADVERNLTAIRGLLEDAPQSDLIVMPEVCLVRGSHHDYIVHAEPIPGPATKCLGKIAASRQSWLLAGSIVEVSDGRTFNTSILFDPHGCIAATYRKIHLFEAFIDTGKLIRESDTYEAGTDPVLVEVEGWKCGMAVCYDVRFPELFRLYAERGADLFFIPSNFTQKTGQDHWEILVRARAIENQCFVLAPNQCGTNPDTGIISHGHSMAVGPWGAVLCEAQTEEQALTVVLDPSELQKTRSRIPVAEHRRISGHTVVRHSASGT